jgi:hypothetical protein
MDNTIKNTVSDLCSGIFSSDLCSFSFMPAKVKLLVSMVLLLLLSVVVYQKIIRDHNHFEHFGGKNNGNCCRKIKYITTNNPRNLNKINKLPNTKLVGLQITNTKCSSYDIEQDKIDKLHKSQQYCHDTMTDRCLNEYKISKMLMKHYTDGRNRFNPNYLLFYKV